MIWLPLLLLSYSCPSSGTTFTNLITRDSDSFISSTARCYYLSSNTTILFHERNGLDIHALVEGTWYNISSDVLGFDSGYDSVVLHVTGEYSTYRAFSYTAFVWPSSCSHYRIVSTVDTKFSVAGGRVANYSMANSESYCFAHSGMFTSHYTMRYDTESSWDVIRTSTNQTRWDRYSGYGDEVYYTNTARVFTFNTDSSVLSDYVTIHTSGSSSLSNSINVKLPTNRIPSTLSSSSYNNLFGDGGLSTGAIVAIVIGSIVGFIFIIAGTVCCCACCCACCMNEADSSSSSSSDKRPRPPQRQPPTGGVFNDRILNQANAVPYTQSEYPPYSGYPQQLGYPQQPSYPAYPQQPGSSYKKEAPPSYNYPQQYSNYGNPSTTQANDVYNPYEV